ncbi:MAG: hypothetical protein WB781_04250, partial [Candidatus Sulfotelmatobacter sp.]
RFLTSEKRWFGMTEVFRTLVRNDKILGTLVPDDKIPWDLVRDGKNSSERSAAAIFGEWSRERNKGE